MKVFSFIFQFSRVFLHYLGLAGGNCLYYPSCGEAIAESLQNKGLIRSVPLIVKRIFTCNTIYKKIGKKWQF